MSVNADYRQLHLLASGGMAQLYLAEAGQGQRAVVKRIRPPYDRDASFRALFEDEGKICAALDSPHIVRLLDRGEDELGPFLVFEYVEGTDLGHVMDAHFARAEPLELAQACAVLQPLLRALVAAHEAQDEQGALLGLVHRDISPGNVLLSARGDVYLADFGVAFSHTKTEHTVAGELKGKFAYMSPEQTQAVSVDARSDLFAVGTLSWEMLTGAHLFDGPTDVDVAQAVRTYVPPEVATLNPLVPARLSAWIASLLAKEANERPATAREALAEFEALLEEQCLEIGLRRHAQHLARAHPRPSQVDTDSNDDNRRRTQRMFRAERQDSSSPKRISFAWLIGATASAALFGGMAWAIWIPAPPEKPATISPIAETASGPLSSSARSTPETATQGVTPAARGASTTPGDPSPAGLPSRSTAAVEGAVVRTSARMPKSVGPVASAPKPKNSPLRLGRVAGSNAARKNRVENRNNKTPAPLPTRASAQNPSAPAQSQGFGMLFLESEPWAYVSIDGAPLGSHTPLLGLRLPAGTHQLELKNPVLGLQKSMKVEIKAGEDARHFLDLTSR